MTGPSRQNPPIETRLDDLLDRLVSGDDIATPDDPELQGLTTLARAIRDDDRIEWPDEAFPGQLTASLYSEIRPANGRVTMDETGPAESWDDQTARLNRHQTATIPESEIAELTGRPARLTDLRRLAGIAAAIVGFGLLTLVLVAVFRGFDDETPAAIGTGVDEDRPSQIAVTMQTDPVGGNPDIFLVSLDGSDPVNLTDNPASDTMPAWSPDGSKIAFISDRSGEDAIYIMEADGSYVHELDPFRNHSTSNPEIDWHYRNLAWSPDGSTIAVMRFSLVPDSNDADVLIIDAGGSGLRVVSMHPDYPGLAVGQTLEWSPDGEWLAFGVYNDEVHRVAVASMSSYLTQPLGFGSAPSWSRSGEIAFSNDRDVTIATFVDDPLALDEVTEFTLPVAQAISQPELSADGSRLVFIASTAGGSSIWISNSDGSDPMEVPDSGFSAYPIWSPDGKQLAFLRFGAFFSAESTGYDLMLYDVEDESLTTVLDTGFDSPLMSPPAWRPGETEVSVARSTATAPPTVEVATNEPSMADPTASPTAESPAITPTPSSAVGPVLFPPQAALRWEDGRVEGYFSSYSWQFSDQDQTYASIEAPTVIFEREPIQLEGGQPLALEIFGEEFTRPPDEVTFELYPYGGNEATDSQGEAIDESAFAIQSEPLLTEIAEDPMSPDVPFLLQTQGRFVIVARASWGSHPILNREVFVTWVFDVIIEATGESFDDPQVQQAIAQVRDFLDDSDAELSVDQVHESAGRTFVNLSRPAPGMENQPQYADQFFVEISDSTIFAADLNSNTLPVQPWNSIDEQAARAIAEDYFEQKNSIPGQFTPVSSETLQLSDHVLNFTWGIQSDGVWLPTTVEVGVSLQTGLVVRYIERDFPYNGPWIPEIPESTARQSAEAIIATDPALEGASIESVRLAATFSNFAEDIQNGQVVREVEAEWRLAWEFTLTDRPGPQATHFIWIDSTTGERLTTGQ